MVAGPKVIFLDEPTTGLERILDGVAALMERGP